MDFTGIVFAGVGADFDSGFYCASLEVAVPFASAGCEFSDYFSLFGAGFSAVVGVFLVGAVFGAGFSSASGGVFFE